MSALFSYLKNAFSEADGSGSSSRLLALLAIVANIVWVSYIVVTKKTLPDLSGSAMYITASFSGYAANKFSEYVKRDKNV